MSNNSPSYLTLIKNRLQKIDRLDPFPNLTTFVGEQMCKPRLVILTTILTKICLDRIYSYAKIVNPNCALDASGEQTLDILEYYHPQTPEDVYNFLVGYGAKGRQAYLSLLFYDSGFLLCRTLPLCLLTYFGFKQAPQWVRPGVWLHLVTTGWDLCENVLLYYLIKMYPSRINFVAWLASGFIQGKWILFWSSITLICISMVFAIYHGFHGMLRDSVLMEKDKREKANARRHVNDALQRQRNKAATSSSSKPSAAAAAAAKKEV
ncbi:hypothetical protein BDB00DRAFT_963972 [Zychaea mexicana]|uniref:uncharacterized protein n=1 Tax=Zychaea mexicana TaxID=64656 RepID=UPI0022FF2B57|nr:uncharacterized protein BDB00DRAFT_963972 [Zychaea mexicana]KAI9488271.1 hypothetical protein BDB00DRAFT_963972 [Zychaea mexicana]